MTNVRSNTAATDAFINLYLEEARGFGLRCNTQILQGDVIGENSTELGDLNSTQTGQLSSLFHAYTNLMKWLQRSEH